MNKEDAIGQLNVIINRNPDCDAEGTQDTTTVRISNEDYEYTVTRKDKVKYIPLSSIKAHKKYKVEPTQTLWGQRPDVTFSYVIKLEPFILLETVTKLFPRSVYSYEARSTLYDDLTFILNNQPGIMKGKVLLVFIGQDGSNKDMLVLMAIDKDSNFFNGQRVIEIRGYANDNF